MSGRTDPRLVTRIALRNYKSIAVCNVYPAPLSLLVGPNGCGKSNFLDALRFVAEALRFSLDHALRDRGGIQEVRRRSGGHPIHFGIRLDLQLPRAECWYAFRVAAKPGGRYNVQQEECFVVGEGGHGFYRVADGKVEASTIRNPPACASDRLYLVNMSGFDVFRPVYDAESAPWTNLDVPPSAITCSPPANCYEWTSSAPTRSGQLRASSICSSAPTGTNNRTMSNGSLPMRDTTHATRDWRAPVRTGDRFSFGSVSMFDSVMCSFIRETTAPWLPALRSPLAVPDEDLP